LANKKGKGAFLKGRHFLKGIGLRKGKGQKKGKGRNPNLRKRA